MITCNQKLKETLYSTYISNFVCDHVLVVVYMCVCTLTYISNFVCDHVLVVVYPSIRNFLLIFCKCRHFKDFLQNRSLN